MYFLHFCRLPYLSINLLVHSRMSLSDKSLASGSSPETSSKKGSKSFCSWQWQTEGIQGGKGCGLIKGSDHHVISSSSAFTFTAWAPGPKSLILRCKGFKRSAFGATHTAAPGNLISPAALIWSNCNGRHCQVKNQRGGNSQTSADDPRKHC